MKTKEEEIIYDKSYACACMGREGRFSPLFLCIALPVIITRLLLPAAATEVAGTVAVAGMEIEAGTGTLSGYIMVPGPALDLFSSFLSPFFSFSSPMASKGSFMSGAAISITSNATGTISVTALLLASV
jgi:hypothetical protein